MAMRKQRLKLKADEAIQFLRCYLADGRKPAEEVKQEARKRGISVDTLNRASIGIVDKRPEKGPEGPNVSYWSLLALAPPARPPRRSKPTIREESTAFKEGYERAVNAMLRQLAIISTCKKTKTTKDLIVRLNKELHDLKELFA